jgi:hypothetical protein
MGRHGGGRAGAPPQAGHDRTAVSGKFDEGDTLRLAVVTSFGDVQWLDAYQSTSSSTEDRYRLEASYWVTPLPRDGLLPLVCAWPEIGLPETMTDVVLPDLAVRAAGTQALWDVAEDL